MMILTFAYRIKDRRAKKALAVHARGVNQVWNYLVARQKDIEARYHAGAPKRPWGSHFDLQKEVKGVGKELGIAQQSAQEVCKQFTISRDRNKSAPRFRASFGLKRALAACRAEAFRLISGEVLPARTFIGLLMVSRTGCNSV
jgi:hypothetical protein